MRRRGGFTLIEITVAVVVLGVFFVLAAKLFRSTMGVIADRSRHEATMRQLDRAADALRADAWGAYELKFVDDHTLIIRPPGDNTLIWKLAPGNIGRGVYLDEKQTAHVDWPTGRGELRFESDGPVVTLTWSDAMGRRRVAVVYSQLRALTGGGT